MTQSPVATLAGFPNIAPGPVQAIVSMRTIKNVLAIFAGDGIAGHTTGNSSGSKWCAWNAIAEQLDYGRRYTSRTNQVQRSFEDTTLKQRALELLLAA
jgi:elongation factor P hydroxylase